jgi:uncharacterized membrane protein
MIFAKNSLHIWLVIGALATFAIAATALGAGEEGNEFVFASVDVPGALRTTAQGINDAGEISGIFLDARGEHGFLLGHGEVTVIDYPGAAWTYVYGINAQGDVVGIYGRPGEPDPLFAPATVVMHGFLRSRKGQFTDVHYPGHLYEIAQRITSTGIILGCYHDTDFMDSMYSFTRSRDGSFEGFPLPNSMHTGATPDGSMIAGIYGSVHSYLLDDGRFLPFDVPDSTLTNALDINPEGDIIGHFRDRAGVFHGFLRNENGEFTSIDFPGSNNTQARGINARREIVGRYTDAAARTRGFLARPREDNSAEH